ncbi:hypothetical protein BU15DRAFT_69735 [Melanogaster broomeanus]|nr:hypothetical protein BU15DRAFT_69735 [Melanogaster broomeanus]
MNFTNINDPAGVKALLDQLRSSQAWQETLNSGAQPVSDPADRLSEAQGQPPSSSAEDGPSEPTAQAPDTSPSSSVASLLSPAEVIGVVVQPYQNAASVTYQNSGLRGSLQHHPPSAVQDLRSTSFQQALPHVTRLSGSPEFVASVLQQEQKDLEQQLWEERCAVHGKHEEKVKVSRTKAALIGAGLSKHEADMMNDAYRRDLQRFDAERAVLAWDALIRKQQAALEALGVPTMFPTGSQAHCEKQRRVVQVLEGIVG